MQYSFYVRMLIEEFVSIFITCLINVMRPKYSTWGEILSFIVAIILIVSYNKITLNIDFTIISTCISCYIHLAKKVNRRKTLKTR
jgi:large-conductance mechanosensitive channel